MLFNVGEQHRTNRLRQQRLFVLYAGYYMNEQIHFIGLTVHSADIFGSRQSAVGNIRTCAIADSRLRIADL